MKLPDDLRARDTDGLRRGWLVLGAALVTLVWLLVVAPLSRWGEQDAYHDWDHHLAYAETGAASLTVHGEPPLWDPYPCGGIPLLAHPQARVAHPMFVAYLVLDGPDAVRVELVLHLLIAAFGMALLVRRVAGAEGVRGIVAPAIAAVLWSGTTALPLHLAEGHLWILPAVYLPLVVWLYELGIDRLTRAALAGAVVALMVFEGGIYPVPHTLLLLSLYGGARAIADRSWRPLAALAVLAAAALLLAAPKLLPMLEYMSRRPRLVDSPEAVPIGALWSALAGRDQSLSRALGWDYWGWHEVGHYVGVAALALAGVGLVRAGRRTWIFAAIVALFAVLGLGAFSPWAPWSLLHRVPLFSSQHAPTRFWLIVVFGVAVLAARGAALVVCWLRSPRQRWIVGTVLVLGIAADVLVVRHGILGPTRCPRVAWPDGAPRGKPIVTVQQVPMSVICRGDAPMSGYSALSSAGRAGVAVIHAYEPMCPRTDRLRAGREPGLYGAGSRGYRGEAWLDVGNGEVVVAGRTHNTTRLELDVDSPAVVVLNQNWDPGWSAEGARVLDHRGRLAVGVERAGHYSVRLRYRPPFLSAGLAFALIGCVGIGLLWWRERRRASRS